MLKSLPKCGRVRIRTVRKRKVGGRRARKCPIAFCSSTVINVMRHLKVSHKELDPEQRGDITDKFKKRSVGEEPAPEGPLLFFLLGTRCQAMQLVCQSAEANGLPSSPRPLHQERDGTLQKAV